MVTVTKSNEKIVETVPKSYGKIVKTEGKSILLTHIQDSSLSRLATGTPIKSGEVTLVIF